VNRTSVWKPYRRCCDLTAADDQRSHTGSEPGSASMYFEVGAIGLAVGASLWRGRRRK
jgi:MYXO-CTERM domain-containing protein